VELETVAQSASNPGLSLDLINDEVQLPPASAANVTGRNL